MYNRKAILKDVIIVILALLGANIIAIPVYMLLDDASQYIISVYILAVAVIARWTDGYIYGTIGSFLAVICVNYFYTYPYLQFNFTMSGYPVAFICMLVVSILISALTTTVKAQENIKLEAEKEKMRANLLRSLSHDIRTPLTTIVGATNAMLTEEKLSESEKKELLTEINEDALGLIKMVENILSITKMGGSGSINKTEEIAEDIIGSAVVKFKKKFPDINIDLKVPENIVIIECDPKLIEQVLLNLLENAAIHGKTVTDIYLSFEVMDGYGIFRVRDNGVGIKDDLIPALFEDYVDRTDNGTRNDLKCNMGIGLAVCSTIVRAHGGQIVAENTGSGAMFTFYLPLEENK